MKLSLNNIAKIKQADIVIDGITVIAGENDTGKSTVGKALFVVYHSFYNINERVKEERLESIVNWLGRIYVNAKGRPLRRIDEKVMAAEIMEHAVDKRNVIYVPENYPKLIYRKLYETVVYYNKALSIDSEKPVKFAFSSQSSKLMDIGMLLTVLALLKKKIKVSIVIVENHGYSGETTYDINGEKLYALCLDESEFDW